MEREVGFDIEETWLYMGLLAQREEAEVTRYIQAKRGQAVLSGQDVAAVEIASEMRSTLREVKANCGKMALTEKGGQYGCEALEKLLGWGVITSEELEVMRLRLTCTYREIGLRMQIDPSTAYRTVERVHNRVRALHKEVSVIRAESGADDAQLEANAKRLQDKILKAQLSVQQWDIYVLLCEGLSNNEVALRLGVKKETVKSQKTRINKARASLGRVCL